MADVLSGGAGNAMGTTRAPTQPKNQPPAPQTGVPAHLARTRHGTVSASGSRVMQATQVKGEAGQLRFAVGCHVVGEDGDGDGGLVCGPVDFSLGVVPGHGSFDDAGADTEPPWLRESAAATEHGDLPHPYRITDWYLTRAACRGFRNKLGADHQGIRRTGRHVARRREY